MEWIDVKKRQPHCWESGKWDGRRSSPILVQVKYEGSYITYLAIAYKGTLDGIKFLDFYDYHGDYELQNVIMWMEIPY